jgi:hypothetical protein
MLKKDGFRLKKKWRHVRYEHGQVDFTHEREWRVQGALI